MNFKEYGINLSTENKFKKKYGINQNSKVSLLKDSHKINFKRSCINKLMDRELFDHINENIAYYKNMKNYRGLRHRNNLPVRGQRTRTNASKKTISLKNLK